MAGDFSVASLFLCSLSASASVIAQRQLRMRKRCGNDTALQPADQKQP
jgi:hypothetical protein